MILLNENRQRLLLLMLIAILLLITPIVIMLQPEIFETFEILDVKRMEIQSMYYNGVPTASEQEFLLKYMNSLQLIKIDDSKFKNTAADVYIYIYDTEKLAYEFWIYGNGNIIETISNSRYHITPQKVSELIGILATF